MGRAKQTSSHSLWWCRVDIVEKGIIGIDCIPLLVYKYYLPIFVLLYICVSGINILSWKRPNLQEEQ